MPNFVYQYTGVSVYYVGSTHTQPANSVYFALKSDRVAVSVILTDYKSTDGQITGIQIKTFQSKKVFRKKVIKIFGRFK